MKMGGILMLMHNIRGLTLVGTCEQGNEQEKYKVV